MVTKLTRLTHKIAIQLHLVVESCKICSSRYRQSVRKLLDTPSYVCMCDVFTEIAMCVFSNIKCIIIILLYQGKNVSMLRFVSSIVDTGIWPLLICFWGEAISQQVRWSDILLAPANEH